MSQNTDKASNAKIATLLEIGLPPGEDHLQLPQLSAATEMGTTDFAVDLPPTANAQPGADYCRISYEGETFKPVVIDVLQPRLRRPEKLGFKRRNRRRTELVRYMGERIIAPEKYRPMLGSRAWLHAVRSVKLVIDGNRKSVAEYYSFDKSLDSAGLKQPANALLPIVRTDVSEVVESKSFKTDIFKGRRSLFRFDSMRPLTPEENSYDSQIALMKVINLTFAPRAGRIVRRDSKSA